MSSQSKYFDIPKFEVTEFSHKKSDYVVFIFVINEGDRLRNQLVRMSSLTNDFDICVADGGSTDGSTEHGYLKLQGVNSILVKKEVGGLGTQMRMAFHWGLERDYKGVIIIDGNGKDGIEAIPQFRKALSEGYDYVQGSRFLPGGLSVNLPLSRWIGLRFIHAPMISAASGFGFTDTTNGFRAYSSRFLRNHKLALFRDFFKGYELHYYLSVKAVKLGFKVKEIPVSRSYPAKGPIVTKISPVKGNLKVLHCLYRSCTNYFDPK